MTERRAFGSVTGSMFGIEPGRIEQPGQIAQHGVAETPLRDHPLQARLELLVGFVVGQAIQQRGLKLILLRKLLRHGPRPYRQAPDRRSP